MSASPVEDDEDRSRLWTRAGQVARVAGKHERYFPLRGQGVVQRAALGLVLGPQLLSLCGNSTALD